ncbi:alpha/beta hydrolase [Deinococcus phoenicis]|uniref:Alpha/beta hydrolase n=1 Tax=Deinococcus phoenicis TaxID=1476583 RepID=A0A016QRS7_9DEIO|nr:alpha/beta hydrolase [Deinococcus phoenicis]EYB68686.1 alpha/beta hydrolase [Deinococcus phoenicis]
MRTNRTAARLLLTALLSLGAAALARAALSAPSPAVPLSSDLRPAVEGERRTLNLPGFGRVAYYAHPGGTGRPLILTHSVNAAASAYEMKPLWDAYAGRRPLYALEWPGFGSSDRPDVRYTPDLMAAALRALVTELGTDVDVVALSLGSEFAARAALEEGRIRSLALISPSGLGQPRGSSQEANAAEKGERLYGTLSSVGTPLYALLRTRPSIHYFLSRSFRGPVDAGLIGYCLDTSRQPGAKNAPLYFISGLLFTPEAYRTLYSKLRVPTTVLYDRDGFVTFDLLPLFVQQPGVQAVRIPGTDGLPQFEQLPQVRAALDAFWAGNP